MHEELKKALKEKFIYWNQEINDDDVMDFSTYDLTKYISSGNKLKLYRYMPASYFNIRNLETQKIHLSTNGVMNDIYEGIPRTRNSISYCQMQKLSNLAYMNCMTEENNNILMWSHYADQNTGICVEYDISQLTEDRFAIKKHLFPVLYEENRIIERDIDSLIESLIELNKAIEEDYVYEGKECLDDILPLFLVKGIPWRYEKEWRIIFTRKQMYDINETQLYEGNLYFPCTTAVYMGYRIHPEIRRNIVEIAKRSVERGKPLRVYQTMLEKKKYGVYFEEVHEI